MNLIALAAFTASQVVPAQPTSFQTVNLRLNTDNCEFEAASIRVTQSANVIRVTHRQEAACSPPGAPRIVDVRLGALPAGDYRVEFYRDIRTSNLPSETFSLQVRDPVEIAIFPPPVRPLTNYSGLWYDPRESGWGLSLHQGPTYTVFGLLFVYDTNRRPDWYSLQSGRWTSSTVWKADVLRTTGPSLGGALFDPSLVQYNPAGSVTIDFTQAPGTEGLARLTYTINGTTATKTIQRMPL